MTSTFQTPLFFMESEGSHLNDAETRSNLFLKNSVTSYALLARPSRLFPCHSRRVFLVGTPFFSTTEKCEGRTKFRHLFLTPWIFASFCVLRKGSISLWQSINRTLC